MAFECFSGRSAEVFEDLSKLHEIAFTDSDMVDVNPVSFFIFYAFLRDFFLRYAFISAERVATPPPLFWVVLIFYKSDVVGEIIWNSQDYAY